MLTHDKTPYRGTIISSSIIGFIHDFLCLKSFLRYFLTRKGCFSIVKEAGLFFNASCTIFNKIYLVDFSAKVKL